MSEFETPLQKPTVEEPTVMESLRKQSGLSTSAASQRDNDHLFGKTLDQRVDAICRDLGEAIVKASFSMS